MSSATLLASAALALITAAGFALVASFMGRRRPPAGDARGAFTAFAVFWGSVAAIWASQGVRPLLAAWGALDFATMRALEQANSAFYCLAAASLLYYVLFLLTGRTRLLIPLGAYYLGVYFALRRHVEAARPYDLVVGDWTVTFAFTTPLQGLGYTLTVAALAGPLLLGILAFAGVVFRVRDAASRYRIVCVATGLLAWVATEALAYTSGVADTTAGEVTRRLVALASTGIVLAGYVPPAFARERWGARRLVEPASER